MATGYRRLASSRLRPLSPLRRFGSGSSSAEATGRAPSPMSLANPIFLSAFVAPIFSATIFLYEGQICRFVSQRKHSPLPHSISRRHNRRALLAATALLLVLAAPARARVVDPGSGPFEVGQTQTGNYLAAIIASDDRDTAGSAFYFRESLARRSPQRRSHRARLRRGAGGRRRDQRVRARRSADHPRPRQQPRAPRARDACDLRGSVRRGARATHDRRRGQGARRHHVVAHGLDLGGHGRSAARAGDRRSRQGRQRGGVPRLSCRPDRGRARQSRRSPAPFEGGL